MSDFSLFDDESEPVKPKRKTAPKAAKPTKTAQATAKKKAPEVQYRAPQREEKLDTLIRSMAKLDMLSDEDADKFSDIVDPIISKESRKKLKTWRSKHGNAQNKAN